MPKAIGKGSKSPAIPIADIPPPITGAGWEYAFRRGGEEPSEAPAEPQEHTDLTVEHKYAKVTPHADTELRLLEGDCIDLIPKLGKFNLIFADPPFNIGHNYKEFNDRKSLGEYETFTRKWIYMCVHALEESGILIIHGHDLLAELVIHTMRTLNNELGIKLYRQAWINWHYRFGQCNRDNWIDARAHCLVYSNSNTGLTWNPDDVLVESDRSSVYGDKRVHDTERGGKRLPGTVWGIPSDGQFWGRVQGNNQERRHGHPNQLPLVYITRLLLAYTNAGDRVLDPFCGSGTTIAVCKELKRNCVTIDVSGSSIKSAHERITDEKCRAITKSRIELFSVEEA